MAALIASAGQEWPTLDIVVRGMALMAEKLDGGWLPSLAAFSAETGAHLYAHLYANRLTPQDRFGRVRLPPLGLTAPRAPHLGVPNENHDQITRTHRFISPL